MSTRALRKLHGKDGLQADIPGEGGSSDLEEGAVPQPVKKSSKKKKKKGAGSVENPFDVLPDEDLDADVLIENAALEDVETTADAQAAEAEKQDAATGSKKAKKKKKKKKKGEGEKMEAQKQDEEDIDATIREVHEMFGETGGATGQQDLLSVNIGGAQFSKALLAVEHKNLNPDNEMRRIFGTRVVQATDQSRRRQRNRVYHKSSWLAQPKDTWPHIGKTGVSMALVETKQGVQHFTIEHNSQYQQVQFQFLDAVESFNPQNIMAVLNMHPYHIDSMIQLSEVCRMGEDIQMATELIERCLYVIECSFHPCFSLTTGNCRLDYRRPENRAFYIAIFRHLMFVGDRGCYRTALEFCKLLLSLDPDGDPMAVLLMIDFYVLKAEQYSFLVRMYQEWESYRNLSQLPNFAFSVPLAMFLEAHQEEQESPEADAMLQTALLMFPGVLMPMLDQCSITPDPQVAAHPFFGPANQLSQPEALKQLVALYVGRCHPCWKIPEVVTWLERNVKEVLKIVNSKDPRVDDYKTRRESRYKGTPRNIFRHIIMSEVKDATAALPPELANTPVLSYDPLPPPDSVVSYTRPPRPIRAQQDQGLFSAFFRSLLPNYNPQEVIEPGAEEGAAGGQGEAFRDGVNALMDAMRNLLQNIQPAAPPIEGEQQQDQDGDERNPEEWE